jgi:hypothetical protein
MKKLLLVLTFAALTSVAFAQFPTFRKHTLMATYISEGYVQSVPPGYAPIDALHTISCPGTSGTCTFQLDAWVAAGNSGTYTSLIELCFYVDGSSVPTYCHYSGELPLDGSTLEVSTSLSKDGIPVGAHTVQTLIYTSYGAVIYHYNSNYKVYKP